MKFSIKNLFNKKSLRKLEKATMVGVASLALIVPLAGNSSTSVFASDSKRDIQIYEEEMDDSGNSMLTDIDQLSLIIEHPALKHTESATSEMQYNYAWGDDTWDFYARHFKQLYSPYLYKYMPKRVNKAAFHYKHDMYLINRARKQMGLLGRRSHRHAHRRVHHTRRTRRNRRHYSHKRHAHRRNARKHRNRRHSRR